MAPSTAPVEIPGREEVDQGRYTLQVGSADLWGTADSFRFLYQPLAGDGRITARVVDFSQTASTAKAGVMIRESLDAGSRYAMARLYANGGVQGQRREATGGGSAAEGTVQSAGNGSGAHWLRLTRRGAIFTAESSPDGVGWTTISTRTVTMASQVYIGLALASWSGKLGTATFDNVSVTSP